MPTTPNTVLALDVGGKRIGIAVASLSARLPAPLTTLTYDDYFFDRLASLIEEEQAVGIVVGLPRNLDGEPTAQTAAVEHFAVHLKEHVALPLYFQDEALTSRQAEAELGAGGKTYDKASVDALAAVYILEDWLADPSNSGIIEQQ